MTKKTTRKSPSEIVPEENEVIFFVSNERGTCATKDGSVSIPMRIIKIKGKDQTWSLHEGKKPDGFWDAMDELRVVIEDDDGIQDEVPLLPFLTTRLLKYLKSSTNEKSNLDSCYFAHHLFGIKDFNNSYENDDWHTHLVMVDNTPQPGVLILLLKSKKETIDGHPTCSGQVSHVAMCLGNDLYLSKGGLSGELFVTTLDHLKKLYDGSVVIQCINKKLSEQVKTLYEKHKDDADKLYAELKALGDS